MAIVGRVARTHGLRGEVFVNAETDFPADRFRPGAEVFVERGGVPTALTVTSVRFQRERPVIALSGIGDIEAAEKLAGAELRVPIDRLARLPEGMFYRHDLVGCRVQTRSGDRVGVVADVEGDLGGSRLIVETEHGQVLVPLAAEICPTIDPAQKLVVIEPPEGLLDLNRSGV